MRTVKEWAKTIAIPVVITGFAVGLAAVPYGCSEDKECRTNYANTMTGKTTTELLPSLNGEG